ncbi:hypothetical protein HMPREF3138_07055 [Serratia sp. HMSC15F11]|nr:hypothetical protein HMPREF3138_07055 [Serratia sp. HMSC15F11]
MIDFNNIDQTVYYLFGSFKSLCLCSKTAICSVRYRNIHQSTSIDQKLIIKLIIIDKFNDFKIYNYLISQYG